MHSPVLINYDPGFVDEYSGWEYETDEFYDDDGAEPTGKHRSQKQASDTLDAPASSTSGKRKPAGSPSRKRKRRKQDIAENEIPGLDLEDMGTSEATLKKLTRPLVVWRKEEERQGVPLPLINDGEGAKVSLLKDWRERVEAAGAALVSRSKPKIKPVDRSAGGAQSGKTQPLSRNTAEQTNDIVGTKKRARKDSVAEDYADSSATDHEEDILEQGSIGLENPKPKALREKSRHDGVQNKQQVKIAEAETTQAVRKSKRLKNG